MGIRSQISQTFVFPNPVNEVSARTVAAGVVVLAITTITTGAHFLVLLLLYGFAARVAAGPRFSPLGLLATRVIVPKLPLQPKIVAGPPKRFAQGIGFAFALAATVAYFVAGSPIAGNAILAVLTAAAFMESALGFCLGCKVFAILMKVGLIPKEICVDCANIWTRQESPVL
ncbi:MAG: DUF4395 domain-containing protein [Acidimicrobiaceae bacterium]|nr:DUF4395 domain-containing protein [Acidimicrobiaceae bacterium]